MKGTKYTDEMLKFIEQNIHNTPSKEVTERFNVHFGTQLSVSAIRGTIQRNGYKSGLCTQFRKGFEPHNKGTKGLSKQNSGCFGQGQIPYNHRPIGTERPTKHGYIMIKTAEPNTWRLKSRHNYEQAYGPIPPAHIITYKDGDKTNCDPENLELLSMHTNARMNKLGYPMAHPEIKPLIKAMAVVEYAIHTQTHQADR